MCRDGMEMMARAIELLVAFEICFAGQARSMERRDVQEFCILGFETMTGHSLDATGKFKISFDFHLYIL